ncbi:MAG TPA: hypothetical protein HPP65_01170 [Gammaproteobacteria bacterium]|jgi:flagellar assembly protein FliH|nr:hypothetical protein [Gammaproteobacteria bacterium]MBT3844877.1 hypothetical protein [Gammaproteobacteria bacterium]MBT3891982.1 hypothetical protein [Gammaproteobacteria bacterium]MBT5688828.1 hypothetical protein [Gammaproteobacteria bacterium]MBT6653659.1 hypothetical protein [Gammaproteobacteria bacterium]
MACVKSNIVSLIRSDEKNVEQALAWEAPSIGNLLDTEPTEPELTEEELALQKVFDEAYQEGLKKGLEEGHTEGAEKGYQEGYKKGSDEALAEVQQQALQDKEALQQQIDTLFEGLTPLLEGLQSPLENKLDETVNQAIASLAVQVAEQVIKSELKVRPEHVVNVVDNLFQQLPMTEREVRLILHPEDKVLIESGLGFSSNGYQWVMEGDESISRGGCRVVSRNFSADETVEHRLQQSVQQIFGEVDLSPAESDKVSEPEAESPSAQDAEATETDEVQGDEAVEAGTQEELAQEEVTQEEVTQEEVTQEEVTQKEVTQEETAQSEVVGEQTSSDTDVASEEKLESQDNPPETVDPVTTPSVAEDENSVEAQGPELHQESVQEPSQEPQSVSMQPQQEVADEQREE